MKKHLFISLLFAFSTILTAQNITGDWHGVLNVQGMKLRLVFHISKADSIYSSTMDSPDQGANGIQMSKTTFENSILNISLKSAKIEYSAKFEGDSMTGTFKQSGMTFPLNITRPIVKPKVIVRSQVPVKPYPYYSEEVTFLNKKDNISLSGTLTLPQRKGKFPVVILISGSGPQNRDEELMGHKPFLVLSDHLTRNGMAVLRFDDRGCYQSTGNFATATTFDFANDVTAAVNYLKSRKEINKKKIGLIGHSEGGIIAPIVASKNKSVNFIILMAGTAVPGSDLLLKQQEDIARASEMDENEIKRVIETNKKIFEMVVEINDIDTLREKITQIIVQNTHLDANAADLQVKQITTPWMINFIQYNPTLALEKVKCPVLAINGTKDLQVSSKINLPAIEKALKKAGNNMTSIIELPDLNHLFQECKVGLPKEYSEIDQTISPLALRTISDWIDKNVK